MYKFINSRDCSFFHNKKHRHSSPLLSTLSLSNLLSGYFPSSGLLRKNIGTHSVENKIYDVVKTKSVPTTKNCQNAFEKNIFCVHVCCSNSESDFTVCF